MDKEFFECDEYIKSAEIQYFPAERYRVNETENVAAESFDAPETSASGNSSAKADDSGMSLGDAEDFVQSASASVSTSTSASASASASAASSSAASLSASASAGVGATGVLSGIAAVCVAGIVGVVPITGLTQNTVAEPSPIEETIDVGTLDFLNYRVDYHSNEDSAVVLSDITFYFEGALADGFTCELSDALTGQSVTVSDDTAILKNIEKGEREISLTIYDGEEVVKTQTINVEDHYIENLTPNFEFAYKVTYNSDNTGNLYAYFTTEYDGEFVTDIQLYDPSGTAVGGYETVSDGALSGALHIKEDNYNAVFVAYYVKDNNYYSYCSSDKITVDNETFSWQASVYDESLTLTFGDEIVGDIRVQVTHDDLTCEEFTVPAKELIDRSCTLTLNKISHNPTVAITVDSVLYNGDPMGRITDFAGEEFRQFSESVNVDAVVSSAISLARCEIFNTSYNSEYGDTIHAPVYLYFDGFLNEGDTYSVRVFNSDGGEVTSVTDLTLSDKPVIFSDLSVDTEYTFAFYLTANGEETQAGEITETLSVLEFPDLPSLFCLTPNPGDVLVTYNGDGTSDVYLYMGVQETVYDMYYKVYLDNVDGSVRFECAGKENVAVFRNIPAGHYAIKVGVLINENGIGYAAYDLQWPSGTVVTGLDESGYYPESCGSAIYDSSTGALTVSVSGKVVGDLRITLTPDGGEPIGLTVPVGDISTGYESSTYTLDLSAYGLTSFTAVIEGYAVFQYGKGDDIKNEVTVTGDEQCPFRIEASF